MGIFSGLFKSRDKPQNRTSGSNYAFFFGGTTSGKAVTERSAMQMTAVYSCVRILSEAVAGLPLNLYKYTDSGGKAMALDHPLYRLLHDEPNPEMSSFVFRETLMTHLLLWGNAYAQIIRNGKGEVVALYPLMPNRMEVNRDKNGKLYYLYSTQSDDAPTMKGSTVYLDPSEVLHIPGLGFDGLVGYSPIAMAKNAIGMAIACEEYGAKFFANGAAPGGVLEHPGTIKDPQRVRESWQSTFGGSGNANKIAVLEEGMKYTPIGISPEQAQFLETRKFQINEIARIFRVPPHMVGDLEKSSFSNIEQQSLEFVKYTLDPWVIRWEQSIQRSLLSKDEKAVYFVKFNLEGLLRGDYQQRQMCIRDRIQERTLFLNGTIAEESWFDDDVTPQLFKDELMSGSGNITVWINSPGGDCVAAAQIYNMLMDYHGDVTVKIDGIAASAASVIAMAGTKVLMSPTALMMIHNPLTVAIGDSEEMQKAIDMLSEVKESIINAYEIKTGLSRAKLSHLMDAETWMNANKAVELGFADDLLFKADAESTAAEDSFVFSRRAVTNSLMSKVKSHHTPSEPAKSAGTPISELEKRLALIKP